MKIYAPLSALCLIACTPAAAPIIKVDFENPAYAAGTNYDRAAQKNDWDVVRSPSRMDGDQAVISESDDSGRTLKITYPPFEQAVKQTAWGLEGRQSYHLSYRVKFADDFEFNGAAGAASGKNGGKLPGLAARPSRDGQAICTGGAVCDPGAGFSARLMWRTDGAGVLYLYDLTKSRTGETWGENFAFANEAKFEADRWHKIDQFIQLNTVGKADGRIKVWLDGSLVVDLKGREIIGGTEAIDTVLFSTFFGGNTVDWFPAKPQTAYFDDFEIWTETPSRLIK